MPPPRMGSWFLNVHIFPFLEMNLVTVCYKLPTTGATCETCITLSLRIIIFGRLAVPKLSKKTISKYQNELIFQIMIRETVFRISLVLTTNRKRKYFEIYLAFSQCYVKCLVKNARWREE